MRRLFALLLAALSCTVMAWDLKWNRGLQEGCDPGLARAYEGLCGPAPAPVVPTAGFSLTRPAFSLAAGPGKLWGDLSGKSGPRWLYYEGKAQLSFEVQDPLERARMKLFRNEERLQGQPLENFFILALGPCADLPPVTGEGAATEIAPASLPFKNAFHADGMDWLRRALEPGLHGAGDIAVLFRMDGYVWAYILDAYEEEEVSLRRLATPPLVESWWWDRVVSLHLAADGRLLPEMTLAERVAKFDADVLRYDVDFTLDKGGNLGEGSTVAVSLDVKRPVRFLRFSMLPLTTVKRVLLDGETPLPFLKENFSRRYFDSEFGLLVQLPEGKRGPLKLTFEVSGDLFDADDWGGICLRSTTSWYPDLDDADGYEFAFRATVPKGWEAVGLGDLLEHKADLPGELELWSYDMKEKVRTASFLYGKFKHLRKTVEGVEVDVVLQDDVRSILLNQNKDEVLEEACDAVGSYTRLFGPIPYKVVRVGMIPSGTSLGLPTLVLLSDAIFARTGSSWPQQLVAHEMAHQWWYNQVAPMTYRDAWVSESLAEFSSFMAIKERADWPEVCKYLSTDYHGMTKLSAVRNQPYIDFGPICLGSRLYTTLDPDSSYQNIVYYKGAWIILNLSRVATFLKCGEAGFYDGLKDLVANSRGKLVSTRDFRAAMERRMGITLDIHFQKMLESTGIPKVDVKTSVEPRDNGFALKVQGTQDGTFTLPIPIQALEGKAKGKQLREFLFLLKPGGAQAEYLVPFKPAEVKVDGYHMCLADYGK